MFGVNVKGLLFTVQKSLQFFQDGGSIILTASIGGSKGYEGLSVYGATKAATIYGSAGRLYHHSRHSRRLDTIDGLDNCKDWE